MATGNMQEEFGKVRLCGFRDMQVVTHTRTHTHTHSHTRHIHYNTLHSFWSEV